jgi:hypothetical protein
MGRKIDRWICLKPGFNRALLIARGFSPGGTSGIKAPNKYQCSIRREFESE